MDSRIARRGTRAGETALRTAIDTNVLSALWSKEPLASRAAERLGKARNDGGLVIGGAVYAELLAYPGATERFVNGFLESTEIAIDFELAKPVWVEAGRRFARYAKRRRTGASTAKSGGMEPKRLFADFIIGSHALVQADRLMTLDPGRYERDFPELTLAVLE